MQQTNEISGRFLALCAVSSAAALLMIFYVEYTLMMSVKISILALIMIGVIGKFKFNKIFIFLGWVGISLYLPIAMIFSIPDPDIIQPAVSTRIMSDARYISILALSFMWAWLFRSGRSSGNKLM